MTGAQGQRVNSVFDRHRGLKGDFAEVVVIAWVATAGPAENIRRTVTKVEHCHVLDISLMLSHDAVMTQFFLGGYFL